MRIEKRAHRNYVVFLMNIKDVINQPNYPIELKNIIINMIEKKKVCARIE